MTPFFAFLHHLAALMARGIGYVSAS